ncbi:MAG: GDSL-type esterase/lipase family protein [Phycisphaerae bacterium]|nr:GDSL-type esterase/lipase family protein [Tepidisphaeraceae bacterium]
MNRLTKLAAAVGLCAAVSAWAEDKPSSPAAGAIQAVSKLGGTGTDATGLKKYADPARFEKSILAFEAKDKTAGTPAPGGVVCVGSSSMVGWHPTIVKDLAPLPVIPRGFGGSNMNDAAFYAERVVVRYRPKAVVLYEGDNDIGAGMTPAQVHDSFQRFCATVHKSLPDTRIYVLSIKPSIKRWSLWPKAVEANKLIQATCAADAKRLTFVPIWEGMLTADGKPREDIYRTDKLHMNPKGYEIWTKAVRAAVVAKETTVAEKTDGAAQ